jgi:hypothetical protein
MGTTTFTGPIKAGPILDTTGTTLGTNVADVGTVILSQVDGVTQSATAAGTDIVIPAGSTIVSISVYVTVVWSGAATTFTLGISSAANELAIDLEGDTLGQVVVAPGANATRTAKWVNVGTTDVRVWIDSANAGTGVGTLVVSYVQGPNTKS